MTLLLGVSFFAFAQQSPFRGVVVDSIQYPVPYAIVTLSKATNESGIIAYSTTNDSGRFELQINSKIHDSLYLSVRHMSFAKKEVVIKDFSKEITVVLDKQENQLKEVLVKAKKNIEIKGDTIRYQVDELKKEKDYTIEEVIDRIPGVSISENGQIKYKDKAISHLYINGVDLLEGRYNIATRGIPADAVKDIEVLQRHNHARIDIGRTESDKVAMNLNIKKDQSLVFGTARADAGLPFLTGRAEATPIYLREKVQNISSLRANNYGKSLTDYGTSLTRGNLDLEVLKLDDTQIINAPNTQGNTISNKYWLDNESFSVTNDALYKAKEKRLFKASADYNFEDAQLQRENNSVFYFNNDSTVVNRSSFDRIVKRRYQGGLIAEINEEDLFLKNKLSLSAQNQDGITQNLQNGLDINTRYNRDTRDVRNLLELKNPLFKKVISSGLLFEYKKDDQLLEVDPAVFATQIPSNGNPSSTFQNAALEKWNLAAYSKFDFEFLKTDWEFKQDIQYRNEQLDNQLFQDDEINNELPFTSSFELSTFRGMSSINAKYEWSRWKLSLRPKISFLDLKRTQDLNNSEQDDQYFFFEPDANLSYSIQNTWNFGLSYSRNLKTSEFNRLYEGLVLTSFSNLSRNPTDINVTRSNQGSLFINYSNILKGFFLRNFTTYDRSIQDFTFTGILDENGLIQIDAIDRENETRTYSNTTSLTKRFFTHLKTEFSYAYREFQSEQFFNNILQENKNSTHGFSLELGWDKGTWYGIKYIGNVNYGISEVNGFRATNLFQKHDLELDLYLSSKTRWNFTAQSAISSFSNNDDVNENTLFSTNFYYKPSKKLFLRASFDNIFDERFFTTLNSSANLISLSRFNLRPRQFTIGLNYTL